MVDFAKYLPRLRRNRLDDTSNLVLSDAFSDIDYGSFNFGGRRDDLDIDGIDRALRDHDDDPSDGYFVHAKLRAHFAPAWEGIRR